MEGIGLEVRAAARGLLRRPGFSTLVVLTLAVAIGADTAIFSVARDVLLRPYPYPDPDRVVAVLGHDVHQPDVSGNVTYPNLADLAEATSSFVGIALQRGWQPALEDDRDAVVIEGATVTADYFAILGVQAGAGRFFRPDEQGTGRAPVVVLDHGLWLDRFGGDPGVVGRDLRLSGETYRVIGVTAADFEDPWIWDGPGHQPRIWRTVSSPPSEWPRSGRSWKGIARVRSDATLESAQEELSAAFAHLVEAYPEANANREMRIVPLLERVAGPVRPVLLVLLASSGLLLLVACANLANLMLARASDRRAELQIHRALGASRWRILGRGLAEASLLSAAGGLLGLGLASVLGSVARRLDAQFLPRPVTGHTDLVVLSFTAAVALGAGLLFGFLPALHASRASAVVPGREWGRALTPGRQGHALRRALVVGELALTVTLLVGAGLLVRSVQHLGGVDLGLRTRGVVAMPLHGSAWWDLDPEAAQAQWDAVLAAAASAPGVESVGAIDYVPLGEDYSCDGIRRPDRPPPAPGEGRCAEVRVVLPGILETLGVSLLAGRSIEARDRVDAPPVAVVDHNLADALWPGEDPLGRRLEVHTRIHEVVGVAADMLPFGPGGDVRPMVYLPAPQEGWNGITRGLTLLARGTEAAAIAAPLRAAVARVNPGIAVGPVDTLDGLLGRSLAGPRLRTALMGAFALAALLLALLGIAGVQSYSVSKRRRELGLRLALGAAPSEVRALVLWEAARLTVAGTVLGLLGSLAVAGAMKALLFQVGARDPAVYAVVALTLGVAALFACWVPASRASRVDPVVSLAAE